MHLHIYVINIKQYSIILQITGPKNKYILDAIPLTRCKQNKNTQIALKEK